MTAAWRKGLQAYLWTPLLLFIMTLLAAAIRLAGVERIRRVAARPATGRLAGWLTRLLLAKKNHYLDDNLALIFPAAETAARDRIRRGYFANLLVTAAESLAMDGSEFERTAFEGVAHLHAARQRGQGILFVSAHLNNWEINRRNIHRLGFDCWSLYRDFSATRFDYLRFNRRQRCGERMISTRQIPQLVAALARGEPAHILLDVRVRGGRNGLLLECCGQPAWTSGFAAEMALKYNLALIPTWLYRSGNGHFRQIFEAPLSLQSAETGIITQRINDSLTRQIMANPAQWLLWDTNRWGH